MSNTKLLSAFTSVALGTLLASATLAQTPAHALPRIEKPTVNAPVTLTDNGDSWTLDNGDSWTLDNGILKATFLKRNGNPTSLVYQGVEVLTHGPSYWEQVPTGTVTTSVTIDPKTNNGERAEVSIKGINPGTPPPEKAAPAAVAAAWTSRPATPWSAASAASTPTPCTRTTPPTPPPAKVKAASSCRT